MLVVGALPGALSGEAQYTDIGRARNEVRDGIAATLTYAREVGMPLAIEPLHPMQAAERACVNTLEHALDLCDELDPASDALFLRNRWSPDFAETVVFADFSKGRSSWTANRSAVLGPRGGIEMPEGLLRAAPLGGESGGGYDPCIALQSDVTLEAGASIEIILMLGAADTPAEAEKLVSRYRATASRLGLCASARKNRTKESLAK